MNNPSRSLLAIARTSRERAEAMTGDELTMLTGDVALSPSALTAMVAAILFQDEAGTEHHPMSLVTMNSLLIASILTSSKL